MTELTSVDGMQIYYGYPAEGAAQDGVENPYHPRTREELLGVLQA